MLGRRGDHAAPRATMSDGVLLLSHGSVERLDELPAFVRAIRRGREASPALLARVRRKYEAIGRSPLRDATAGQASLLSAALGLPVVAAARFSEPRVEEALGALDARGVERAAVLALAPFSGEIYAAVAEQARERVCTSGARAPRLVPVPDWGAEPALAEVHVQRIEEAAPLGSRHEHAIVLSAHSLPLRVIAAGDPYAAGVEAQAALIGARLARPVTLAYQSDGDEGEWLGPPLADALAAVARAGAREVTVAPLGFLAEHVETLYDLDIEARAAAEALGLVFHRARTPDDAPALIALLASLVRRALGG